MLTVSSWIDLPDVLKSRSAGWESSIGAKKYQGADSPESWSISNTAAYAALAHDFKDQGGQRAADGRKGPESHLILLGEAFTIINGKNFQM